MDNIIITGASRTGIGTRLNGHIAPLDSMDNNSVSINLGAGSAIVGSNPTRQKKRGPSPREWTCRYCGISIVSRKKLYEHEKECTERLKLPLDSLGRVNSNYRFDKQAALAKAVETVKAKNGGVYKGHPQSAESRAKCAASMQAYRKSIGKFCKANFNSKACEYIDQLNKLKGWNLIHEQICFSKHR